MRISTTFRIEWDRDSGEELKDFSRKYNSFRKHVEHMQAKGSLPIDHVEWIIKKVPIGNVIEGIVVNVEAASQ